MRRSGIVKRARKLHWHGNTCLSHGAERNKRLQLSDGQQRLRRWRSGKDKPRGRAGRKKHGERMRRGGGAERRGDGASGKASCGGSKKQKPLRSLRGWKSLRG